MKQADIGIIVCGSRKNQTWAFPAKVRTQLLELCKGKRGLHLFGGQADFGTRLDIDPLTRPDVIGDTWLPPFGKDSFDVVILDPPYTSMNEKTKNALFLGAGHIARELVVMFHTTIYETAPGLRLEKLWLVHVGRNCAARALAVFRVIRKLGPVRYFERGPALKYNRWLQQPHGLPFPAPPA